MAYAEPNYIRRQQLSPSDEFFDRQWHYPLINLPQAWDTTTGNADVIVAVVDTGVLFDHPDLHDRLTNTGYDFVSDPASALDGDGIDPDPTDAQKSGKQYFHGSHVAGTIAAQTNNGMGVAGVGWNTHIMPVRALGEGGIGTNYDIMQAVRYAAALLDDVTGLPDNDSGTVPAQKADIINLSLSGANKSELEQSIYDEVRAEGIIVVAAAGNGPSSQPVYPAAYDGVLAVSAVDINEQPAWYSNFGSYVDLAAPGGDLSVDLDGDGYGDGVLSTAADIDSNGNLSYRYSYLEGTSMAAAHVSGVIALMKAVNPTLTPDDIEGLLFDGSITQDLGDPGKDDRYGFGLIDAQKAVLAAAPALLTVSPASLDFGTELSSVDLTVDKIGPGPLAILSVTVNATWLSIEKNPTVGDGDVPARYNIQVDRTGLAPGDYRATITIESDNNTIDVPVTMTVAAPPLLPSTRLTVEPTSLDFGTEKIEDVLTVDKNGTDQITVTSVSVDRQWVEIEEFSPGAGGSGNLPTQYRIQVKRTGLAPGDYNARITIVSVNNTLVVPVTMQVAAQVALPTYLMVSPGSIFLGSSLSSADFTVDKNGNDTITVQSVTSDALWLTIEEINPGDGQSGVFPTQYRVQVDRTNLSPGDYEATISFVSDNNTVEVSVFMQVVGVADVANGALYVQLRDPNSFETVYQKTVYSEGGLYRFNFDGVAAGRYLISAGTDLDNDKFIGDGGEAYLSLAQPVILQVDQNLSGLDFGAGFNLTLSAQSRQAAEVGRRQEFIPAL